MSTFGQPYVERVAVFTGYGLWVEELDKLRVARSRLLRDTRADGLRNSHCREPENITRWRPALKPGYTFLYVLIAVCTAIEFALSLADLGLIGPEHLRLLAYDYGAFWPGLLGDWKPNYALQPLAMFFTYAFLHGGLFHLTVNMITLWSLGYAVLQRVPQGKFMLLYVGTGLSGAVFFALLAPGLRPMVGASGSLFGLLGALMAWDYSERATLREGITDAARILGLLLVLNLVFWWAMPGELAWQTHLGGFLGGWLLAQLIRPEPEKSR